MLIGAFSVTRDVKPYEQNINNQKSETEYKKRSLEIRTHLEILRKHVSRTFYQNVFLLKLISVINCNKMLMSAVPVE